MPAVHVAVGAPRTVNVVASGSAGTELREAITASEALQLRVIAAQFTDLVVDPAFPGDVVVLAEEPSRALFAHAQTAAAAGALVVVHADVDEELHDALTATGAAVVPLSESADTVAAHARGPRHARRRPASVLPEVDRRPRLSSGERRALAHYVQGLTTVQVASEMGVGYETAKTFLRRVRAKYASLDRPASKRAQLIIRAEEDGIL